MKKSEKSLEIVLIFYIYQIHHYLNDIKTYGVYCGYDVVGVA